MDIELNELMLAPLFPSVCFVVHVHVFLFGQLRLFMLLEICVEIWIIHGKTTEILD